MFDVVGSSHKKVLLFTIAYQAGSKDGSADGLSRQSWRNNNYLPKEGKVLRFSK